MSSTQTSSFRPHGEPISKHGGLPPVRAEQRSASPSVVDWLSGRDLDAQAGATLTNPYSQAAWVYICVRALAKSLASVPWRVSRVGAGNARRIRAWRGTARPEARAWMRRQMEGDVLESGPIVDLFTAPHPSMNGTMFWEQIVSWNALRGEFFIVPLDASDAPVDLKDRRPVVQRMLCLTPDLFWHMVQGYELAFWRYTGSPLMSPLPSEMLNPGEVIHSREVNPYLYWRGMSPLSVASLPASADYAAEMFMKGLLMNNADTGIIATTDQNLTQEQREQFTAALRERKRKAGTPDRPLFLSSGVKIEKPGISNVDMQFLETRKFLRQEIGAIYGVPDVVMGFNDNSGSLSDGGNAIENGRLSFYEHTIAPLCARIECALDPVVKTFGEDLVGWFDLESLPIFQAARRARVDTAAKVFNMGIPANEINRIYDLGWPETPWGKKGFLPIGLQEASSAAEPVDAPELPLPPAAPPAPEPEDQEDQEDQTDQADPTDPTDPEKEASLFARCAHLLRGQAPAAAWQRHQRARKPVITAYEKAVSRVFFDYRKHIFARLEHELGAKAAPGWNTQRRGLIDMIFDPRTFATQMVTRLNPVHALALETASTQAMAEIAADPWKMPPPLVAAFQGQRQAGLEKVAATVRDQLNTVITNGTTAGDSIDTIADAIRAKWGDLSKGEAKRIAMTETAASYGYARNEAFRAAGVTGKKWLTSGLDNTRPAHLKAGHDYNIAIPMNTPFRVGGEALMYPGDPAGSPENVINCHCVMVAARLDNA